MNEALLTTEERERVLEIIASRIEGYRLETPAILFLEINRPFAGITSLAAHGITPLFGAFTGLATAERYASLLGDRDAVDSLICRLEKSRAARENRPEAKTGSQSPELDTRNSEPI